MDILCTNCGEPWDTDTVLHDDPKDFVRRGAAVIRCPACPKDGSHPKLSEDERERLLAARDLGELLGDDVDGYAAELADLGLHDDGESS
jgi:hypothetical protein